MSQDEDLRELERLSITDPAAALELRARRSRMGLCPEPADHERLRRFDAALAWLMSRGRAHVRCERTFDGKPDWHADIYDDDLTIHTTGATLEEAVERVRARPRGLLAEG